MEKTHIIKSLTFQMENVAKIFHNITEAYLNQEVKNNITKYPYLESCIDLLTYEQSPDALACHIVQILDSVQATT